MYLSEYAKSLELDGSVNQLSPTRVYSILKNLEIIREMHRL